jgi:hypothetical protein
MDVLNLRKLVNKVREILAKRMCPDEVDLSETFSRLRRDDPLNLFSQKVISAEAAAIVKADLYKYNEVAHDVTVKSQQSIAQSVSNQQSSVWLELFRLAYADAPAALPERQDIPTVLQYFTISEEINCYS